MADVLEVLFGGVDELGEAAEVGWVDAELLVGVVDGAAGVAHEGGAGDSSVIE
ncbi:hypothetical protein [Nocardioides sp. CF8]|uniref:hypothetical protein n=1 Tax=Nocardioides sp. CF8 TaxID=110319 RepID=UPI0018DE481D|nr:hypothetical protein [Nocardioides sp. CF8]